MMQDFLIMVCPFLLGGSLHICTHIMVGADEVMGSHGNSSVIGVFEQTC